MKPVPHTTDLRQIAASLAVCAVFAVTCTVLWWAIGLFASLLISELRGLI